MKIKFFFALLIFTFTTPLLTEAQEPHWLIKLKQIDFLSNASRIKLLKTTRAEVEQILGKPDLRRAGKGDFIRIYIVESAEFWITYTTKECSSKSGLVNKDVVEEISFYPEADIPFSILKIPTRKFRKYWESDTPILNYENKKYGVTIAVQNNEINAIYFYPFENEGFNCPD